MAIMAKQSTDYQEDKPTLSAKKRRRYSLKVIAEKHKAKNLEGTRDEFGRPRLWTKERLDEIAKLFLEWMEQPESLYVNTFYWRMGIHPENVGEFSKRSEDFAQVVATSKIWQEQKIVTDTWTRKISEGMTKMFLAKHHDYKDKTELSGNSASPLSFILSSIDSKTKDITIDTNAITDKSDSE
jgi:hypothetical protein